MTMVISKMSPFSKYFICIDAIALEYRINLLVLYPLHKTQNATLHGAINRTTRTAIREIASQLLHRRGLSNP
jgi:hypothetical protein